MERTFSGIIVSNYRYLTPRSFSNIPRDNEGSGFWASVYLINGEELRIVLSLNRVADTNLELSSEVASDFRQN